MPMCQYANVPIFPAAYVMTAQIMGILSNCYIILISALLN